jgi:transposase
MPSDRPRSASERIQDRMQAMRARGMSWSAVAKILGVSKGAAWRMARGIEPANTKARHAFGLPPKVGPRTQYQQVRYCKEHRCRKAFVPNHPQRRRCFECSPFRRHK